VGEVDGLVQMLGAHEPQHRSEALRAVEEGPAANAELDPRRPEVRVPAYHPRLEEPLLAFVQCGEGAPERFARWLGQRRDSVPRVPRAARIEAGRGIAELTAENGVVVDLGLADGETRRRTLLPLMAEGRANQVANGLVAVGERRDDHRVLAARLGEECEIGAPG